MIVNFNRPHSPTQSQFIKDFTRSKTAFVAGLGSGKSFAHVEKGIRLLTYNAGCNGLSVAPTYDLAEMILIPEYEKALKHYGIKYKTILSKMMIKTPLGKIYIRSGNHPERIIGFEVAWAGLDEIFTMDERVYKKAVERVRGKNVRLPHIFMTGTPEGVTNWGYELIENKMEFQLYQGSTLEAVQYGIQTQDYVDRLYEMFDAALVNGYIHGQFVNLNTNIIFYNFTREKNVDPESKYCEHLPLLIGCDFNLNPMSWVIGQLWPDGVLFVIDEIRIKNTDTGEAVKELLHRYEHHNHAFFIFGDASARARHTIDSHITDAWIIENALRDAGKKYVMSINTTNPPVRSRNNLVNGLFCNAKGKIKLIINPACKYVIKDLFTADYKPGTMIPNKTQNESKDIGHLADGLGYMAFAIYGKTQKHAA